MDLPVSHPSYEAMKPHHEPTSIRNSVCKKFRAVCVAICARCYFKGTDLHKCGHCNHSFGKNVKTIGYPNQQFSTGVSQYQYKKLQLKQTASATITEELLEIAVIPQRIASLKEWVNGKNSLPPPDFNIVEASSTVPAGSSVLKRSLEQQDTNNTSESEVWGVPSILNDAVDSDGVTGKKVLNLDPQNMGMDFKFERRLRIIQHDGYKSGGHIKSILFRLMKQPNMEYNSIFHARTDFADTIVEETGSMDKPQSLRILQLPPSKASAIIQNQSYKAHLKRITFACPISLRLFLQILNFPTELASIRFGTFAFDLMDDGCSFQLEGRTFPKIKSFEMGFDKSTYNQCDYKERKILEKKMSSVLQIASFYFPNLTKCDILIPTRIEAQLDIFLISYPNKLKKSTKISNLTEQTIQFYMDD